MEGLTQQKTKRRRLNPIHRWTSDETRDMLETVLDEVKNNPELFEKPTAQMFYARIMEKTACVRALNWIVLKNKMRNLKSSYISASTWKSQTGAGLLSEGLDNSVTEYIQRVCPFWNILEQIFGQRKNVNPAIIIETSHSGFNESVSYDQLEEPLTLPVEPANEIFDGDDAAFNFDDVYGENLIWEDTRPASDAEIETNFDPEVIHNEQEEINIESSDTPTTSTRNRNLETLKTKLKQGQRKTKCSSNSGSISALVAMQDKKLLFEEKKWERQREFDEQKLEIEKEKINLARMQIEQQTTIQKLEIERDERLALANMKIEAEVRERVQKYELELRARYNNH